MTTPATFISLGEYCHYCHQRDLPLNRTSVEFTEGGTEFRLHVLLPGGVWLR